MDALSIFITVVATVLAIAFKWFLYKKIRNWMDTDLVKGLAENNPEKLAYLQQQMAELKSANTPRSQLHEKLTKLASGYELSH